MEFTYEELKKNTVAQLREIAKGLEKEEVKGYTQMNKEHLLAALCKALCVDEHKHHVVVGINKAEVKKQIRNLKLKRDDALESGDKKQHKILIRRIHNLKRKIHRATV
ncbi:MAG: hypothetical protein ABFR75_11070 [Acidobacteriota bacterium]